jgi:hypothetical protein
MKPGLYVGVLLLWLSITSAHAAGRLTAELRPTSAKSSDAAGLGNGQISLVLKNDGDQVIEVLKDDIPMTNSRGQLIAGNIIVTGTDGEEVGYTGIIADYDERLLRTTRLPPNKSVVTSISIVKNYRVAAGESYTVALSRPIRYVDRPREQFADTSNASLLGLMKEAKVDSLRITIDPRIDLSALRSSRTAAVIQQCSSEQLSLFKRHQLLSAEQCQTRVGQRGRRAAL